MVMSYFLDRSKFVKVGTITSKIMDVICGIPQGSILDPLLFLIYKNDIVNVSDVAELIMLAYDTHVFLNNTSHGWMIYIHRRILYYINWYYDLN